MTTIQTGPISDKALLKDFIEAGTFVASRFPKWIPRLELEMRDHLSQKNPYFQTAEVLFLVACNEKGKPEGRLSLQFPKNETGKAHFGFPAATNETTLKALLKEAEKICSNKGCDILEGPYSFSMNDEVGLLVEGFEHPQRLLMNYAPRWYAQILEDNGFSGVKDLLAYDMAAQNDLPEKVGKMTAYAKKTKDIYIRSVQLKNLKSDLRIIQSIFNQAWAKNWGFIPMSEQDLDYMAKTMKPVLDPDLAYIAFIKNKPVAMIVALPNINEAISDLKGRLLPFGWAKLIYRLKIRKLKSSRVLLMGVLPEHQSSIIGSTLSILLIQEVHQSIRDKKMDTIELSWILEDNTSIQKIIKMVGGEITRRYRIYQKDLNKNE